MAKNLTQKQINFCHKYIECGNASEAYRFAYNAENMKPESITRKASELMANGIVSAMVQELRDKATETFDITIEQKKKWLQQIVDLGLKKIYDAQGNEVPTDMSSARGAIAELNKMDGHLASFKHEVKGDGITFNLSFGDKNAQN